MMKPGRELDAKVAEAMGWTDIQDQGYTPVGRDLCGTSPDRQGGWDGFGRQFVPLFSTRWGAAGDAWEWLQKEVETNPPKGWKQVDGQVYLLALADYDGPAIMLIQDTDFDLPLYWEREPEYPYNWYIPGETYPHAIALAVVEAGKAKRKANEGD